LLAAALALKGGGLCARGERSATGEHACERRRRE
jgi:hypothetical protein